MITMYAIEYGYADDRRFMPEALDLDAAHAAAKFLRGQGLAPTVVKMQLEPEEIMRRGDIVGTTTAPGSSRPLTRPKRTGLV